MISAQIIKQSISQLQAITRVDLTVMDLAGGIVASTTDGAEISSCQVINGTEIQNYNENMNVSWLHAGAIVGNNAGTLSSNT